MVKSLWCFAAVLCLGAFSDLTYTDLSFNRLDLPELNKLLSEYPHQKIQIHFFRAEALFLSGKPRAAQEVLKKVDEECSLLGKKAPSREEAACLLGELGFFPKRNEMGYYLKHTQFEKRLKALSSSALSFEERAYLEGRILWRIPEAFGGSTGKSLLALEALKRLKPQLSSLDFFKGQILESEGRIRLASRAYEEALNASPPDPRTVWKNRFQNKPGGVSFGLVANPAGGVGALLSYQESHLGDGDRHWNLFLSGQSRGVYRGKVLYQDGELLPPWTTSFSIQGAREIDQFFGWGAKSQLKDLTEVTQTTLNLKVGFKKQVSPFYVRAAVGGFIRNASQVAGPLSSASALLEAQQSLLPEFEFGFAQKGQEIGATFFGAQESFFSTHTFSGFLLRARLHFELSHRNSLALFSSYRLVSEKAPFAFLTALSGNLSLPGVRPGRFRETQGGAASLQWEHSLDAQWRLTGFGNLGVLGNPVLGGGGISLGWGALPFRSQIEFGHFAGENIILAGVQWVDG